MQDPPPTIGDKNGSFELVVDVVKLLERLICKAMQTDWSKERGTDLDRAVKLFLSDVHRLDGCVRSDRKEGKPLVIRKSNFISLLTLGP
mgnify:FL=1